MLDYQRIVDDVRSTMYSNSMEGIDFLRAAAADYSVACDEANERLRQCGKLLRQGLRSEAIQLAEIEPNLLDLVATLDFPERWQWEPIVAQYGIVPPVPLMFDVAADLNEAYAIEQPLAELLKEHRLQALGRRSLRTRIKTLRSLAQLDINNPIWHEDVQTFEAERLKELQREVANASQAGDLSAIATLDDELRTGGWSAPVPDSLVQWTATERRKLEDRDARAYLERLAAGLHEAHAACDAEAGRQWRQHWNAAAKPVVWTNDDPTHLFALPALEWLTEQDQLDARRAEHEAAVERLRSALRGKAAIGDLKPLRKAAISGGFTLPADVDFKYRDRIRDLERKSKRIRVGLIAGAGMATVLIAALIAYVVSRSSFDGRVEDARATLADLLSHDDLAGAQQDLARLNEQSPAVAATAPIQALAAQLNDAVQKENERLQLFKEAIESAMAKGAEQPNFDALREATALAKTDAEKRSVQKFKDAVVAAQREADQKHDAEYVAGLEPFTVRLKSLRAFVESEDPAAAIEVERFHDDLAAYDKVADPSPAAKAHADELRSGLKELQGRLALRGEVAPALREISNAIGDPQVFKSALASFVRQFPDEPRSADFKRAIEDAPLWEGVGKWNALLHALAAIDVTALSPKSAKEAAVKNCGSAGDNTGLPDADAVRLRLRYLNSVVGRIDADGKGIVEPLKNLFTDPLVTGVWMVQDKRYGRRFYLKLEPDGRATSISYITGFDMAEKKQAVEIEQPASKAPQAKIAEAARPLLRGLMGDNWEPTFYRIVKATLDAGDVDAILKASILRQTLEVGGRGSDVFQRAFAKHLDALKDAEVAADANWLDPKDPAAPGERHKAEKALRELPDLATAAKAVAEDLDQLRRPAAKERRWIGWLRRGRGGQWLCEPSPTPEQNGQLVAATRRGFGAGIAFSVVGNVSSGVPKIEFPTGAVPVEGSPLYLVAKEKP